MTQTRPHVIFDSRLYRRKPKRRRLIIVNKARFVFATMLALILLSIVLTYITGSFMSVAATNQKFIEVTVVPGDTLWDIATQYNYYDEDVRQVLYNIQKANQITSSDIYPGEVLLIPMTK